MLGVVTCHFNPNGYKRLVSNYWRFRDELKYPIVTVEMAMGDSPFIIPDAIHIRGNERNHLWQKERLLNIAIESLPPEIDKVAWIDADLLFMNKDWALETEKKLDEYPVVQLFEGVVDLTSTDGFDRREIGWAYARTIGDTEAQLGFRRPGGAWAFRRETILDGMYDKSILGSGDALQLFAWTNDWKAWHLKQMPSLFRKQFMQWGWKHWEAVQANIGYVSGECIHLYHGTRQNRLYSERNAWLIESNFNEDDVVIDENGLLAWATDKPLLHQRVKDYFPLRKEDDATG